MYGGQKRGTFLRNLNFLHRHVEFKFMDFAKLELLLSFCLFSQLRL